MVISDSGKDFGGIDISKKLIKQRVVLLVGVVVVVVVGVIVLGRAVVVMVGAEVGVVVGEVVVVYKLELYLRSNQLLYFEG